MRKQSEPLESLHAQPRGLQADTSAVAVASIVPSLMIFLVKGLQFAAQSFCVMRVRVEAVSCSQLQQTLLCLASTHIAYFACHYA